MSCSKGVFRVRKADLNALDNGVIETVPSSVYGKADGMESTQCNGAGKPAGWKSRDGRLWFATSKGLVVVDPKTARVNNRPPPVFIEQILVDRKPAQGPRAEARVARANGETESGAGASDLELRRLVLPPGRGELEFDYTALDFQAPEHCRFKYRLKGVDEDWIDAGTRRVAHYNNVYPGSYHFQVQACNPDGVWNSAGAVMELELRPHFWQTWPWRGSAMVLILGAVGGIARYATKKRMQRKLERLEQRHAIEKERGRIAKDMHDQLGAGLTQVGLLGELARRDAGQPEQTKAHVGELCGVVRELAQTLDEIVWTVNPKNDTLNKLAAYIAVYAEEFFRAADMRCLLDIPPGLPPYPLSAELRHNLFLTVKEALNNVVKHAGASEVWLRFKLQEDRLEIEVEDNGRGFCVEAVDALGNGLTGMKERIEGIGGSFALASRPNQGTRIQFYIPLDGVKPLAQIEERSLIK
jgi:signal transduction histidine kinase